MKAPKEHTEKVMIVQAKFMPQSGTNSTLKEEQDYRRLVDEARDLRLSLNSPSNQGNTEGLNTRAIEANYSASWKNERK